MEMNWKWKWGRLKRENYRGKNLNVDYFNVTKEPKKLIKFIANLNILDFEDYILIFLHLRLKLRIPVAWWTSRTPCTSSIFHCIFHCICRIYHTSVALKSSDHHQYGLNLNNSTFQRELRQSIDNLRLECR